MITVNRMSEEQARGEIAKQGLVYNKTVPLTMAAAANIAGRAVAIEKIEPKTRVDLVTDSSGKVLFYLPAEAEEKIDVAGLRNEMEGKIAEIQKKNADNLKTMDAAYQKKLDKMNKTIEDLRTKIGK
jgi:hypothetical protein